MTQKAPVLTPAQEFLIKLEMERNDLSYLQSAKPKPRVVYITQKVYPKSREERDKMMFHAGRFAMGARDKAAVEANTKYEQELENEDRKSV